MCGERAVRDATSDENATQRLERSAIERAAHFWLLRCAALFLHNLLFLRFARFLQQTRGAQQPTRQRDVEM
jgi:hypothetical protein